MAARLYQNALSFYQSVKRVPGLATASVYIQMAKCFKGNGLEFKAEECFQTAIQVDENNIEARIELAKMYEALNQQEQAFIFINEIIAINRREESQNISPRKPRRQYRKKGALPLPAPPPESSNDQSFVSIKRPRTYKPRRLADPAERVKEETARADQLQRRYLTLQREYERMRVGDGTSTQKWMEAAKDLVDDFRGCKAFYPWDKFVRFLGYSRDARIQVETPLDSNLIAMADRLSQSLFPHLS